MNAFTVSADNRVLASGYLIGRVYEHPNMSAPLKPGRWFAVYEGGILGIHSARGPAALSVIHAAGYDDAKDTDIDYEETA